MLGPRVSFRSRSRGVTLVLTLLLLAVLSLAMAQQTLRSGTTRMAALAESFALESQWVVGGVAEQWLARATDPAVDWAAMAADCEWQVGEVRVAVRTSAAEHKVCVRAVEPERWLTAWRGQPGSADLLLVQDPKRVLTDSGFTAIECLLDSRHVSDRDAYVSRRDAAALADVLTVWGDGKVDLNRAPRHVLTVALRGFTDAQVSAILRLRERDPLDSLDVVALKLGLSEAQRGVLDQVGTFSPRYLEVLVDVRRGGLSAMYRVVVDVQSGQIAEVRLIQ